jgi:hypothetical protein
VLANFLLTAAGASVVRVWGSLAIFLLADDAVFSPSKKGFSNVKNSELSVTASTPGISPLDPKHLLLYLFLLSFLLQSTASAVCDLFTTGGTFVAKF